MAQQAEQSQQQMPMKTPQDLFVHEPTDMRNAEQIIIQMLGEAQSMVQDRQLKQGLQQHEQESRQQARNIDEVFQQMGTQPHPVRCYAIEGLRQELQDIARSNPAPQVLEGAVVGGAAKTEHYEIGAYTGLIEKARAMGQTDAVRLVEQNPQQEQNMLRQVEQMSRQMTQQMATMGRAQTGQQPSATAI